ncbi:MAG: DUF4293 domain-containing protein [Bacteroidota bacterium]
MLQRIQSLYLLVVVIAYVLLFFFPVAQFSANGMVYSFSLLEITNGNSNSTIPLIIAVVLLIITVLLTIFLYKKRVLQIKITGILVLAHIGFILALFYAAGTVTKSVDAVATYDAAAYIALVPLIFLVLANRAIRKDEKLVRSNDRLR